MFQLPFIIAAESAALSDSFQQLTVAICAVAAGLFVHLAKAIWDINTERRMKMIQQAIAVAYGVTNEVAKFTDTKVDDKIAFALGELKKQLEARGVSMTPDVITQAKGAWAAMHAEEKLKLVASHVMPMPAKPSPLTPPAAP